MRSSGKRRSAGIWTLVSAGLALAPLQTVLACSLVPSWHYRGKDFVAFFGTATSDTVRAGPGRMAPVIEPGHSGDGRRGVPFGQRIRIDQLGHEARRRFGPRATHAIMVPWDYSASCRIVAWRRSARWLPPGARGLYRAALRPRALWAGGEPTFDVVTVFDQPYHSDPLLDRGVPVLAGDTATMLRPDELLALLDQLPPRRAVPDSLAAIRALGVFAKDSTRLTKGPANLLRGDVWAEIDDARRRAIRAPIAGIFRVEAWIDSVAPRPFFLQVAKEADNVFGRRSRTAADHHGFPPPKGYELSAAAAATRAALPPSCGMANDRVLGSVQLDWHSPVPTDGKGHWTGELIGEVLDAVLTPEELEATRVVERVKVEARLATVRSTRDSETPPAPAPTVRFSQRRGEPMMVEGTVVMRGGQIVRVRGARIARTPLSCSRRGDGGT